jgi:hypothetical protein
MFLCGIVFAWFGHALKSARNQQLVVEAIQQDGGIVEYDFIRDSYVDFGGLIEGSPAAEPPKRLQRRLGVNFFSNVAQVDLENIAARERTLAGLKYLRRLKVLRLGGNFTINGSPNLTRLNDLQVLGLDGATNADEALCQLRGHQELRVLVLWGSDVSDAGLKHLRGLYGLRELLLESTDITDAGLEHLISLTKLERLDLRRTKVTDTGIVHLQCLAGLRELRLEATPVTRDGITSFRRAVPRCECPELDALMREDGAEGMTQRRRR